MTLVLMSISWFDLHLKPKKQRSGKMVILIHIAPLMFPQLLIPSTQANKSLWILKGELTDLKNASVANKTIAHYSLVYRVGKKANTVVEKKTWCF